jgi:hypothetical protein
VQKLKNGKAADIFGITAEHLKYASHEVPTFLNTIANDVLTTGKIPDTMKTGLITPAPKKGKSARCPDSYRRITVSSVLGKVVEKEIVQRIRPTLNQTKSILQFGVTQSCSSVNAVFTLTETIADAVDHST